ncbi:MAG TPA: hypothetical protein V6D04_11980, partial [Candidatus Obscuribacterales bacterium]
LDLRLMESERSLINHCFAFIFFVSDRTTVVSDRHETRRLPHCGDLVAHALIAQKQRAGISLNDLWVVLLLREEWELWEMWLELFRI